MQRDKETKFKIASVLLVLVLALTACNVAADSDAQAQTGVTATATLAPAEPTAAPPVSGSAAIIPALEGTLGEIYADVNPSVVHIQVVVDNEAQELPSIPGFSLPQPGPQQGQGSGFVWDKEGHIVTNHHVVEGADRINVVFWDDTIVPATIVATDQDSDLAVLMVDAAAEQLHPVALGDSTQAQVGELVIAIGNPFGQEGSMTVGIVSAVGRLLPVQAQSSTGSRYSIPDVIQTDASINPGNSGGVLLNDQGQVIGVTTAILSPTGVSSGIGFAVPSAIVQKVVPALIAEGQYQHPYLGILGTSLTPTIAEAMDLPQTQRGALVIEVRPDGPAEAADLRGSDREVEIEGQTARVGGDVITAVDEQPVQSMDDLITYLARHGQVGQSVTLTVLRDGREQQVQVTLQARPEEEPRETAAAQQAWLGIRGTSMAPPLARAMDLPEDLGGVLVVQVVDNSPADEAGFRGSTTPAEINGRQVLIGGDVIVAVEGEEVADLESLRETLSRYGPGDEITFTLLREGDEIELPVTLEAAPQ